MICYHCGRRLGSSNRCLHCGKDVTVYRKLVGTSNAYYNLGLEKARERYLTEAVDYLKISLHYNKNNTDARNLLGLIYFEMGEVCEALAQWIVSKNLQPEKNRCEAYLELLKSDRKLLDDMDQAVKKYNQARNQAKIQGSDLAIITLKRVIRQSPHFLKAYQLLIMIYLRNEDYAQANRILKRALEIDRGNALCLEYQKELQSRSGVKLTGTGTSYGGTADMKGASDAEARLSARLERREGDSMASHRGREVSGGLNTVVAVAIGMLITMFLYQFVILRTVNRDLNAQLNQQIAYYDARLEAKALEAKSLQDQLDALTTENDTMKEDMKDYTSEDGVITQFDKLMQLANTYITSDTKDVDDMVAVFKKISRNASRNKGYRKLYDTMYQYLMVDCVEVIYEEGLTLISNDYWTQSLKKFEKCVSINPDFDKAIYYIGLVYYHKNDTATANKYFAKIVREYPDSIFYEDSVSYVGTNPNADGTQPTEAAAEEQE